MKKDKFLILLLFLEVLILVLLLTRSFGKQEVIHISPDASADSGEERTIFSQELSVKPAAYDVTVNYTSVSDPENPDKKSYGDVTGDISFSLDRGGLRSNTLYLTDGTETGRTRIWITTWGRISDLQMNIHYNGTGSLEVQDIDLRENMLFRITKTVSFLILSLLIDLGYLFFSGRRFQKRKWIIAGLLFTIGFSSALAGGNSFINGDDLTFHLHRIVSLSDAIHSGNIPQRIELTMLHGYGYASPLFYGEIFLIVPALLYLFCVPLQICYQVYVILVNIATCLITYWCVKKISDDDMTATAGSFLYTCCAYRLTNIYQRAAVGEYTAMTFFPLIVYGFYHLYEKSDRDSYCLRDYFPLVLGLSGVIETHVLSVEMSAILIGIFVLFHLRETFRIKRFLALVKTVILTFLLNAWLLIPMLSSLRQDLKVSDRQNHIGKTRLDVGRVFSLLFEHGLHQLTAGFVLLLGIFLYLSVKLLPDKWKTDPKTMRALDAANGLGILTILFVLPYCQWDNFYDISQKLGSLLGIIQFSWRYLAFASVLLVFGIVFSFMIIRENVSAHKYYAVVGGFVLFTAVFAASFVSAVTAETVSGGSYNLHRYYMDNMQTDLTLGKPVGINEYIYNGEYLPADMDRGILLRTDITAAPDIQVSDYEIVGNTRRMFVQNDSGDSGDISVPLVYYDNYHAYSDDDSEISVSESGDCRVQLTIPAHYEGRVTVQYAEPFSWRIAEAVTLATIVACFAVFVRKSRKEKGL